MVGCVIIYSQPSCVFRPVHGTSIREIHQSTHSPSFDSRRSWFTRTAAIVAGAVFTPNARAAALPSSVGEAIRKSASIIPGLGPADIYYPDSWMGTWKISRQVVMPDRSTEETYQLEYRVRYITSVQDAFVVADRCFNQAELETAIRTRFQSTRDEASVVRSCEWTASNPNDLRLVMGDGTRKEIKVTKRSTSDDGWSSTSEFQRVTVEDARFVPDISARRVLTKWRILNSTSIEGIELVYDAGITVGDPMAAMTPPSSQGQKLLSKSRIHLDRL